MERVRPGVDFVVAAVRKSDDASSPTRVHVVYKDVVRNENRTFDTDGPGERAIGGPRHDNDKVYIDKITILPSADECCSLRAPWMPSKDIDSAHFLPHGYMRNLDIHFRLLRHDSVEKIRDINYNAIQRAFLDDATCDGFCERDFLATNVGNRYFLYHSLKVEDLTAGEHDGVMIRMSFDCPNQLRGRLMHKSTRLSKGMLCAVLVLNHDTNELSIHYFNIEMRHSTYSLTSRKGNGKRAAVELAMLPDATEQDIRDTLSIAIGVRPNISMAIVEYPKLLYAGFANVLHCLQRMTDFDYAFGQYISPRSEAFENDETQLHVRPPAYSEQPDSSFDLSPLTGNRDSRFSLEDLSDGKIQQTLKHLQESTTLDHGQAIALLSSLTREFSFTQGPPGCGKTYLGVALTRVLLASRPVGSEKPILVVCRTNHALDSFLTGLRDAGVERLLRVGNGSKAEWTKSINLRVVSQENNYSPEEKSNRFHITEKKDAAWALLDAWCRDLSKELLTGVPCWQLVYPIVRDHYPTLYSQLVTRIDKPAACGFTYDYWARGGDLATIESLHQELMARLNSHLKENEKADLSEEMVKSLLADIAAFTQAQSSSAGKDGLWHLKLEHRQELVREWQTKVSKEQTVAQVQSVHEQHKKLLKSATAIRDDRYIRTMSKQNVIGMTTTACASRRELLQAVGFEIMICEEAAEVLEAHNLCSLLPTLKHAIHIGDPQQLRPSVEEQSLALENPRGRRYRLDESLFERIMRPIDHRAKTIPTAKLNIQRRMHPDIASISRVTYPFLQDHESTHLHKLPTGLQRRLWWFDHEVPEDSVDGVSKSVTNQHEVDLVKELVTYLLRGNDYNYGNIAVLTPYAGQMLKLREALSTEFSVWLNDEDKESLVEAGTLDPDADDLDEQKKRSISMNDYIRLATIDNFQGEEAKILILSTVRSGACLGFVKSANRINVACSRARDGFYVVGNAKSLETDPKWRAIVNVFRTQQSIADYVRLQCDRHPEHHILAQTAHEIASFAACTNICQEELPCGHSCPEPCHDSALHNIISCKQACNKTLECGHECQSTCSEPCGPCARKVPRYLDSCGHTALVPCSGESVVCDHFVGHHELPCGKHSIGYNCGESVEGKTCGTACGESLSCFHQCDAVCGKGHLEGDHPGCTQTCQNILACGHQCVLACHSGTDCPPCEQPAKPACCHNMTERKCSDVSEPCLIPVSATGPDGKLQDVTCSLTKSAPTSRTTAELLTPSDAESLIQPIISTFLTRVDTLNAQLTHRSQILTRTLQLFLMQQLQSSTMAVKNSITAILHRTDETTTLQNRIITEQHLLSTFDNTLHLLSTFYPGQTITGLNGILRSQLHTLELRVALMKASDTFAIVTYLAGCDDPSRQMQRVAEQLTLFTKIELNKLFKKVEGDVLVEYLVEEGRGLLSEMAERGMKEGEARFQVEVETDV